MPIIEVQFQSAVFFDLVRHRINLMSPPVPSVPEFGSMPGGLVDRWECASVALATSGQTEELDPLPSGSIRLSATISLYLTTYAAAKAAGSGVIPETTPLELTVLIRLLGGAGTVLTVEMEKVFLGDLEVPPAFIGNVALDPVSFGGFGTISVVKTWIGS